MAILAGIGAFGAIVLGGMFALRFRDRLHLILGFSAGAVIAVAFLDLIPESLELAELAGRPIAVLEIALLGFLGYMILDRYVLFHSHDHDDANGQRTNARGIVGAASFAVHSFLDGMAIGIAFQASSAIGMVVALAVLVHGFSDGMNTVNTILKNNGNQRTVLTMLAIDACAPLLGIGATQFVSFEPSVLAIILSLFAGFFIYIGASDLLPESHHRHPKIWTTIATVIGMLVTYALIAVVGHT